MPESFCRIRLRVGFNCRAADYRRRRVSDRRGSGDTIATSLVRPRPLDRWRPTGGWLYARLQPSDIQMGLYGESHIHSSDRRADFQISTEYQRGFQFVLLEHHLFK